MWPRSQFCCVVSLKKLMSGLYKSVGQYEGRAIGL